MLEIDPLLAMFAGAIGVLWMAYTLVQEARIRAGLKREEVCEARIESLEKREAEREQEAKEYLAVIVMMGTGSDEQNLANSREIAANILRGRKGYGG
jgi:hypothetical protein